MVKSQYFPHLLGATALAMMFSAVSVHPLPAPDTTGSSLNPALAASVETMCLASSATELEGAGNR